MVSGSLKFSSNHFDDEAYAFFLFFFTGIHNLDIYDLLSLVNKRLTSRVIAYAINKTAFLSPY